MKIDKQNELKKNDLTELVFILDRSGSMAGLEADTIGGFNAMLDKQRALEGRCRITTVLFDNDYELLHDGVDLAEVSPLTEEQYFVRGTTALVDAIGRTIGKITARRDEAGSVLFVIMTDGMENASREFTADRVRQLIEFRQADYGWEFLFLGANIDAVQTADQYGIRGSRAQNWHHDAKGVQGNFWSLNEAITNLRATRELPDDWNASIQDDFENRDAR